MSDEFTGVDEGYSLLEQDFENAPEMKVVPGNNKYNLKLLKLQVKKSKKDEPYIAAVIEIMDEPTALPIFHFVGMIPRVGDEGRNATRNRSDIKTFFTAWGLDFQTVLGELMQSGESDSAVGQEVTAVLGEKFNNEGNAENTIKSYAVA